MCTICIKNTVFYVFFVKKLIFTTQTVAYIKKYVFFKKCYKFYKNVAERPGKQLTLFGDFFARK